jgi:hypothetical protein
MKGMKVCIKVSGNQGFEVSRFQGFEVLRNQSFRVSGALRFLGFKKSSFKGFEVLNRDFDAFMTLGSGF